MLTVINKNGNYSGVQYPEIKKSIVEHHINQGETLVWLERKVNQEYEEVTIDGETENIPIAETPTSEELENLITLEDVVDLNDLKQLLADLTEMVLEV